MKEEIQMYDSDYFKRRKKKNRFFSGKRKYIERNRDIINLINPTSNDIILEVGCAEGDTTFYLSNYSKKIIGIDFSDVAIKIAKKRHGKNNIKFMKANATNIDFIDDNSIDKIAAIDFIEHIDDSTLKNFFKECHRTLKQEGIIAIYTPQRLHWVEIIKHILKMDPTHIGVKTANQILKISQEQDFMLHKLYFSVNPYPFFRYVDKFFMKFPIINNLFRFRICMRLKKR